MTERDRELDRLKRTRPRSRFLRWSAALLGALVVYSWFSGDIEIADLFKERRLQSLDRFVSREIVPYPLQGKEWDWGVFGAWAGDLLSDRGMPGFWATLAMSVLAIVLAGIGGMLLSLPGARNLMTPEPFLPSGRPPPGVVSLSFTAALYVARFVQLFLRAIPEFVWAYLFLAMLGPTAWPAVLALAVHNAGVLGKLNSEVIENLEPGTLRSLRGLGADRGQIVAAAVFPVALPRFLLYFFYRFETCVREATILGMLGIVSLGYWIQDARARRHFDEMLFLVVLGAAIVLIGDLVSAVARRAVRKAV